ncbi:sigma-70 family RNA polymerase sigma factor [Streptomyces sp. BPTC-684]|uniref:RNA polymerase sigma factor n=1 Tax=Streptomyces sp. BPTC-684 TaxID=3043734 RepID=UPI0024B18BDD|nr:sigma-70 family RNA polymerase sigma factor [Streptomyces sp. BPTC-684]WHM40829.1 sigma-70 family RNA polymerase sigma factor [Streptomyces sp. BPTC-684]
MADRTWPGVTLVAAAQRGDVAALTALVDGSYPHVHRFAHTLCATPQDAEDAAQEALIILYRKIGMLRASGALASWMFRIVRNECLRRSRALLRRGPADEPGRLGTSGRVDASGGAARSAEEDVLLRLEAERVAAAVASLPDDQRQVLVMREIQGLPGRTVADRLQLSNAAMKSRLHRARSAVREALRDEPAATRGTDDDA